MVEIEYENPTHAYADKSGLYLNRFITSKCAPDLLAWGMFPNVKEITESYSMVEASSHIGEGYEWNNPDVTVIAVGDGHKPRTAATFAVRTAWTCHSVDPKLANMKWPVIRLITHKNPIELCQFDCQGPVLIAACHSHAKLDNCLKVIRAPQIAVVAMECCVPQRINGQEPDEVYRDRNVWSPKNEIKIWRNVA